MKNKLKPLYNTVYLKDFKERHREEKKNGIILNTVFDPTGTKECVHEATILATPLWNQETGDKTELKEGDRVLCHHFLNDPACVKMHGDQKISELLYLNIYAKYNNDIIEPVQNYIFIEPIKESATKMVNGLIQKRKGYKNRVGVVRHISPRAHEDGIRIGETVVFKKNREYEMLINETLYYKMTSDDIELVYQDEDLDKLSIQ